MQTDGGSGGGKETLWLNRSLYRVVQLNFTPEIEVFYVLFDRSLSIFSMTSLKQSMENFNFRCEKYL